MKKTLVSITTFSLFSNICLGTLLALTNTASATEKNTSDWLINKELKFHYAHIETKRDEELKKNSNFKIDNFDIPEMASFSKATLPDITNISLKGILDLGFPLPTREKPEDYKFFLKFYDYPQTLDPKVSSEKILSPFLLYKLKGSDNIASYVSNRKNVFIKDGFIEKNEFKFSRTNPYPILKVPMGLSNSDKTVKFSSQELFDSGIPFCSLYIKTKSKLANNASTNDKISWSSKGLKSIYSEILDTYKNVYTEVKGTESEKYYYFISNSYNLSEKAQFTLIKLPKAPMIFNNVKDLPMPNDPDHVFLSGLLLIFKTNYFTEVNQNLNDLIIDSPDFNKNNIKTGENILELGSVVKL